MTAARPKGYNEVIVPAVWKQSTFTTKAAPEILGQMYAFKDKGDHDICLTPEVTPIIQEQYNTSWARSWPKPIRIFYVQRCYCYDRPQKGRYREFTQMGVELLGGVNPDGRLEVLSLLEQVLGLFPVGYEFKQGVKRGLSYYIEDGFEVDVANLGAQKQVAGGERYKEGVGWTIGLDRLLFCMEEVRNSGKE